MKTTITIVFAMLTGSLLAQDSAKPPDSGAPLSWGGFENSGSATFGYRFTDVSGYQPKFQELFNLRQGPRLLDFSLFGKAQGRREPLRRRLLPYGKRNRRRSLRRRATDGAQKPAV